jgi:protein TonB
MNATTVPPPGWNPIGAPEIRANTRRFFTRALAISGAGHLVVLAALLWVQSRAVETAPRLYEGIIRVIPAPPPPILYKPPADPGGVSRGAPLPPDDGTLILKPEVRVPTSREPVTEVGGKTQPGDAPPAPPSTGGTVIDPAPAEGAFVAYDRPPVPYYRPAPGYPPWAREAGIEGRVVLHALVGRDGRVTRITVLRDVEGLTDAAREAIARWLFHPALSGKNPVPVWVEIPIEFKL